MVHEFQNQPVRHIQDLYCDVLDAIMFEFNIAPAQDPPDHIVLDNASFPDVFRNTDWYCRRGDSRAHYRYRRYREVLGRIGLPTGNYPIAHVDIGCGAGLFSWAFLDWARDGNVSYDRVDLYGLDHSREMINLAHRMRDGLMQKIPKYPNLRYAHDAEALMQELTANHRSGTIYIVTFGHVLVQAHKRDDTARFPQVITHICNLEAQQSCILLAVDARGECTAFKDAWRGLLTDLKKAGIEHELFTVAPTLINDANSAKIARLSGAAR